MYAYKTLTRWEYVNTMEQRSSFIYKPSYMRQLHDISALKMSVQQIFAGRERTSKVG